MAQDYTYLVSRLRSIEASMPDIAWFQRMARSPVESLVGSFREFYPGFDGVDTLYGFEKGIEAEKVLKLDLVTSLIQDGRVVEFLRGAYDFDNMLQLWKGARLQRKTVTNPYGLVDEETLERAVSSGVLTGLPERLKPFLERLQSGGSSVTLAMVENTGEPVKWEFLLDSAPTADARRYVVRRIDLANIKTFIRLKRTTMLFGDTDFYWIGGGELEASLLEELFREPEDELYNHLGFTEYRGLVRRGLNLDTPLWKVDATLTAQLLDMIGGSRQSFFDIMPVIYHLELCERDYTLLRMVAMGRLNRLPEDMILGKIDAMTL